MLCQMKGVLPPLKITPDGGTILVVGANNLVNCPVYLFPVAGSNHNPGVIKDVLEMTQIARHNNSVNGNQVKSIALAALFYQLRVHQGDELSLQVRRR